MKHPFINKSNPYIKKFLLNRNTGLFLVYYF